MRPKLDRGFHMPTENVRGERVIKRSKSHESGAPSLGYGHSSTVIYMVTSSNSYARALIFC